MNNDNIVRLALGGKDIVLVGTAHVSRESIDEVREIIIAEKPGMVCVELDEGRYKQMFQKERGSSGATDWEKLDIIKVFREGKGFLLLANLVLGSFQRRIGSALGVKPGMEMREAILAAEELGVPYVFCDREIQITLNRAWRNCGAWSKAKLLSTLLGSAFSNEKLNEEEIENLKKSSALDGMMDELSSFLPEVKQTLIDERDQFLAAKIWGASAGASTLIAVVGAGHLSGIKKHITEIAGGGESVDLTAISAVPAKKTGGKIVPWLLPALIVALIAAGFFRSGADVSMAMLLRWILWNGSLAALGSLLALAHPLSILVSFVGAPIATINPFIGVGLFSGVVEATLRRPRVEDAETLNEAIASLKGIYKNRITRALLVFFLSSMGGAIGNFISIPALATRLFG
jgi:pheromone shutdown-related protein TraB